MTDGLLPANRGAVQCREGEIWHCPKPLCLRLIERRIHSVTVSLLIDVSTLCYYFFVDLLFFYPLVFLRVVVDPLIHCIPQTDNDRWQGGLACQYLHPPTTLLFLVCFCVPCQIDGLPRLSP